MLILYRRLKCIYIFILSIIVTIWTMQCEATFFQSYTKLISYNTITGPWSITGTRALSYHSLNISRSPCHRCLKNTFHRFFLQWSLSQWRIESFVPTLYLHYRSLLYYLANQTIYCYPFNLLLWSLIFITRNFLYIFPYLNI